MNTQVQLEYGKGAYEFNIPSDRYIGVLMPREAEPLANLDKTLSESLAHPVASPPLADGQPPTPFDKGNFKGSNRH